MNRYETCVRTDKSKPIEWSASDGYFPNAEEEDESYAQTPQEAAEYYVEKHLSANGLGWLFEENGGEIDHYNDSINEAKVEVWVREEPGEDYSKPDWKQYFVRINARVEYEVISS